MTTVDAASSVCAALLCSGLLYSLCFHGTDVKLSLGRNLLEYCNKLPPSSQKTRRPNIFLLHCLLILVREKSTACAQTFLLTFKRSLTIFAQRKELLVNLALPTVRPKLIRINQRDYRRKLIKVNCSYKQREASL